ncbi:autotransporter-associated beta strand repeat-containing protein [Xanthobacter pseudotagetidis]|uniref:autotransporter-associated beta strand repeat-containing protein n=1 Tax=Xanthobacter pseudotagetidis TaxID=3119911 RepID=UPI003729C264
MIDDHGYSERGACRLIGVDRSSFQYQREADAATVIAVLVVVQVAIARPNLLPRVALLVPFVAILWMTGHFERVREFVRKPCVIGSHMHANGFRVEDYPLLQRDGVLAYATCSNPLTPAEQAGLPLGLSEAQRKARLAEIQLGKDVFMTTCSRCHTGHGVNAVTAHRTAVIHEADVTHLTGANTYSGGTWLTGGTLVVAADASLGGAVGGIAFDGGSDQIEQSARIAPEGSDP